VSHSALIGFVALSGIHLLIALSGHETMWGFGIMQFLVMACFGLAGSNFGAMAMEPMGALAGTAASVQGFISTVSAALIGIAVGQQFNGTVVPVITGFFLLGLAALAITLWTEGGRLFQAHHEPTTTV
jgi:DHA1 family bicyclomycin/chloramphenicol resistance-like MFS transporter